MRPQKTLKTFHVVLFLLLVLSCSSAVSPAQERVPQFKDYPVREQYRGETHAPLLGSREARMFRTRLREAARGKPNFAGRYIVATWGCGTACLQGALIDARTGRVYMLPATRCCWQAVDENFKPVEFRPDSRLIILSGSRNEKEGDEGTHFYKFENNRFVLIRTVRR